MRSTPFDLMSSACFRNPGRCVFEHPGVKEPGTPKITTRLLATSSEKEIGVPSSCWIEIPGADDPTEGPVDIFDRVRGRGAGTVRVRGDARGSANQKRGGRYKDIKTKEEGF